MVRRLDGPGFCAIGQFVIVLVVACRIPGMQRSAAVNAILAVPISMVGEFSCYSSHAGHPIEIVVIKIMVIFQNLAFYVALAIIVGAGFPVAAAQETDELSSRLSLYEGEGGASCSYFLAGILPWRQRQGDWRDAQGKLFGDQPYAVAKPGAQSAVWDVTKMVRGWGASGIRRGGVFLRPVTGTGYAKFHSREARSVSDWPMLAVDYSDGRSDLLEPIADTFLDCSTYRSIGKSEALLVSGGHSALLQFRLPVQTSAREITRARLVLSTINQSGAIGIGVFSMAVPDFPAAPVRQGLAAEFPFDRGIERHPDVVFSTGFEEGGGLRGWKSRWANGASGEMDLVAEDAKLRFLPLDETALRINLKKGSNFGADLRLYLKDHGGEPDELYFRYQLRLADDWNPNVDGGKMPGLAGTYGQAGWGGRRADGSNGWSMRGSFSASLAKDHPMRGFTQLGTYAYHAEMSDFYGESWIWPGALLARNRWYSIEQFVRLNRPGVSDGIMRVWVDGRLIMERTTIRFRNLDRLRIETVWLNVYHGGTAPSPHDQHLYIDNVVVARRYIGPMAGPSLSPAGGSVR